MCRWAWELSQPMVQGAFEGVDKISRAGIRQSFLKFHKNILSPIYDAESVLNLVVKIPV